MEASDELYAATALPPGQEPLVPTEKEACWPPGTVWTFWIWVKISCPCRESNHDSSVVQPEASSLTQWATPN
jgi:hypothetical protein